MESTTEKKKIYAVVKEGGERLYIHPVAVYAHREELNRIQFLVTPEFPPYTNWHIIDFKEWLFGDGFVRPFFRTSSEVKYNLWAAIFFIKVFCLKVSAALKYAFGARLKHRFWHFRYFLREAVSINCAEIFDNCIPGGLNYEIQYPDGECLFEENYLSPGQELLRKKVDEWLNFSKKPETECIKLAIVFSRYEEESKREFREWRDRNVARGCEIIYLCSLDT